MCMKVYNTCITTQRFYVSHCIYYDGSLTVKLAMIFHVLINAQRFNKFATRLLFLTCRGLICKYAGVSAIFSDLDQ